MAGKECLFDGWDREARAFEVVASEFVVATASAADVHEYTPLSALLDRVRKAFGIEAAFVSEWAGGEPVARGHAERGELDALQRLYGSRLLQADAPFAGSFRFDAAPVVTDDGTWHGTLCCRRPVKAGHGEEDPAQAHALQSVAHLIADWFNQAQPALAP